MWNIFLLMQSLLANMYFKRVMNIIFFAILILDWKNEYINENKTKK